MTKGKKRKYFLWIFYFEDFRWISWNWPSINRTLINNTGHRRMYLRQSLTHYRALLKTECLHYPTKTLQASREHQESPGINPTIILAPQANCKMHFTDRRPDSENHSHPWCVSYTYYIMSRIRAKIGNAVYLFLVYKQVRRTACRIDGNKAATL